MNNRYLTLPLALSLALATPSLQAMGLGQLQVKSGLNQPLVAEIPIISATPAELDQLDVRLASPDAFARVGLERPRDLTANLQFSVGKNARGQPVIRVTTTGKFNEPLLSFLIEAEWGKGTVTREYTALIDPPYIAPAIIRPLNPATVATAPVRVGPPPAPAPAPEVAPTRPAPEPAQTLPASEPEPVSVAPTPEPVAPEPVPATPEPAPAPVAAQPPEPQPVYAPPPAPAPAPAAPGQYGPVASGQTLWSIAESVRPDAGITINQMMLALLRANPDAFDGDNINRLKRGSVLRIPGKEDANALSAAEAAVRVHEQAVAWGAPQQPVPQPAETIAEAPAPAKPRPQATPAAPVAQASRPSQSRLEIVPPSGKSTARGAQSGAAAGAGGAELRAELTQAREDLAARTSEVTELKSRVNDLEQINAQQQKMIQVQDSEMKALQDRLQQLEVAGTAAPAAAPAAPTAENPEAAKPAAKAPVKPAPPKPEAAPWYFNPYVLGGGGLIVLAGLVFALRRGRGKPTEEAAPSRRISEDEALRASLAKTRTTPASKPEPVAEAPSAAPAKPAPAAKPIPAAPAPAAPVAAPAAVVEDPLRALESAVRARPQDLEAHLSLLRYHHTHGNAADYETAAQAMRMQVSSTMDPRWREAVVMGAALLPGHPLFSQAGWNTPRFNEGEAVPRAAEVPAAASAPAQAPEPAPAPVAVPEVEEEPAPAVVDLTSELGEPALDFELGGRGTVSSADIHRKEAEMMAEDENSATRIELAKAYLDIGDLDGARSMLEEVLADGGPLAKAEAQRILKEIG